MASAVMSTVAGEAVSPPCDAALQGFPQVVIGGLPIAVVDRQACADWMVRVAKERPRGGLPLFLTSANGEVIARAAADAGFARILQEADQIVADGQPMVLASRLCCHTALPERVATTDLFHDVAARAEAEGLSFYLFGATPEENARAVDRVRALYPRLRIAGACHGYLSGAALEAQVQEINRAAPDILWLGLGVPHEQHFVQRHRAALSAVGMIKTSGGLFNFLSGSRKRAPGWMQKASLEWAWRVWLEPKRLFWRYALTNPRAIYLMARRSR